MEHPILFNGEMVRAILEGRKTQTRRLVPGKRISPHAYYEGVLADGFTHQWYEQRDGIVTQQGCRYVVGDRLWVRETFVLTQFGKPVYRADCRDKDGYVWPSIAEDPDGVTWKPSIHMPRWASRIALEVTDIQANVLSAGYDLYCMTQADVVAEGFTDWLSFELAWDAIYAPKGKGILTSPWVWAISFRVVA